MPTIFVSKTRTVDDVKITFTSPGFSGRVRYVFPTSAFQCALIFEASSFYTEIAYVIRIANEEIKGEFKNNRDTTVNIVQSNNVLSSFISYDCPMEDPLCVEIDKCTTMCIGKAIVINI